MDCYAVIMAGGFGSRFWPLSRQNMPKQFLNLSGNGVMLNDTIQRLMNTTQLSRTYIVANMSHEDAIHKCIMEGFPMDHVLYEPFSRNTAACITYAAMAISKKHGDALMCVLPADHYIGEQSRFDEAMQKACIAAEDTGKLVTIGIQPTFPSTGYGYIFYDKSPYLEWHCHKVIDFIEKPNLETASRYVRSGEHLWNSGIFVWKISSILKNIHRFMPELFHEMNSIKDCIGKSSGWENIKEVYKNLKSISIDYGVLEMCDDILVIPGQFPWSDVGSWEVLESVFPTDSSGNVIHAEHIGYDNHGSVIYGEERLIAAIGLKNMVIIDTKDAILICPKERAQEVKTIVELLNKRGMKEYT